MKLTIPAMVSGRDYSEEMSVTEFIVTLASGLTFRVTADNDSLYLTPGQAVILTPDGLDIRLDLDDKPHYVSWDTEAIPKLGDET